MTHTDQWPRWQDRRGISDLSIAVDEIYALRAMLADEADILAAHLSYKTFPKTRRAFAEAQLERMRQAAAGDYWSGQRRVDYDGTRALRRLGIDGCLTNDQWARQRGLTLVERPGDANA